MPNLPNGVETVRPLAAVAGSLGLAKITNQAAPRPEFDLPLAVVLASAAFEAYLQPKDGNGFQKCTVKDGSTTTYFDTSLLTGRYAGVLEVELVRASNLRGRDYSTFSDPYAIISTSLSDPNAVGSTTSCSFRTTTVPNSLNPEWQETHRVCIRCTASAGPGAVTGATVEVHCRFLSFANAADLAKLEAFATQRWTPAPVLAGLQAAEGRWGWRWWQQRFRSCGRRCWPARGAAVASAAPDGPTAALPEGKQVPTTWASLEAQLGRTGAGLTPVAFLESKKTETQVWLYRNVERREVVIAFRGTELAKWKDIATDIRVSPTPRLEPLDDSADAPISARKVRYAICRVGAHGLFAAYDSVQQSLYMLLDAVTVPAPGTMPWTPSHAQQAIYGAPRVGNEPFVEEYDRLVRNTWRVINTDDIVPSVPSLLGYRHVGHAVQLDEQGEVRVIHKTVGEVGEQAGRWDEDYTKVPEGGLEIGLLEALLTGAGVKEHMQTSYLASLQLAVDAAAAQAAVHGKVQMRIPYYH
ncbi:hypothetical protein TSOC_002413 [Tetrabaena socialis]|uniref:C2 domain-containing protein n=1 Tax=Tetrabaena socialis TaxID=47790 RepID=A0A2J8AE59_9CHLO|nr:hypothetical protein TSOC_002413 [Tetrabaena socialis]|eukprot:PNH10811.1 hypothetical protein TSOC_002413 [Tetrabaena socialis]